MRLKQSKTHRFVIVLYFHLLENERNPNMESLYDYGSRAGFWRYHRLFTSRKVPITVFAVGMVRITQHLYSFSCPKVFQFRSLAEYIMYIIFESFRPRQLILLVAHEPTNRHWNAIRQFVTH